MAAAAGRRTMRGAQTLAGLLMTRPSPFWGRSLHVWLQQYVYHCDHARRTYDCNWYAVLLLYNQKSCNIIANDQHFLLFCVRWPSSAGCDCYIVALVAVLPCIKCLMLGRQANTRCIGCCVALTCLSTGEEANIRHPCH